MSSMNWLSGSSEALEGTLLGPSVNSPFFLAWLLTEETYPGEKSIPAALAALTTSLGFMFRRSRMNWVLLLFFLAAMDCLVVSDEQESQRHETEQARLFALLAISTFCPSLKCLYLPEQVFLLHAGC
jgi:hypothetical protein